jgi:ubiquinone/menaquinone biosynthesis C-methylase UbiE
LRVTNAPHQHWQAAYEARAATEVPWYEPVPRRSLELIRAAGLATGAAIVDVGGGASTLVDHLLAECFTDVTVVDVAPAALESSRLRLGDRATQVSWIAADVTQWEPPRRYELWHDRAVFHFLVDAERRGRYLAALERAVAPGGHVVIASFGPDGPERCSGLDVQRYSADELDDVLGPAYRLVTADLDEHVTPGGRVQQFVYGCWRREP